MSAPRRQFAAGRSLPARHLTLLLLSGLICAGATPVVPPAQAGPPEASRDVSPYAGFVAEAARRFDIPERWIWAVMRVESRGRVRAVSPKGAMGLMQIMPDTWAELRARYSLGADPYDPRNNILAGAAYLREMHDRYGAPGFLAAYNAGPGRYDDYVASGRPLPAETFAYAAALAPLVGSEPLARGIVVAVANPLEWTRAPLFVAHSYSGGAADPALNERQSNGDRTAARRDSDGAAEHTTGGLFVARSNGGGPR